jgi:hypothetical protein
MPRFLKLSSLICIALSAACSTPRAELTFHSGTADGNGYDFVVPRTIIKIASTSQDVKSATEAAKAADDAAKAPKAANAAAPPDSTQAKTVGTSSLSFTYVPLSSDPDGNDLPRFYVQGEETSGFALTPTNLSSASYADNLILSAIGTQVTDNRSTAIGAGISILGLVASAAGLGFAAATERDCVTTPLPAFVLDTLTDVTGSFVPNTKCWGYNVKTLRTEQQNDPKLRSVKPIAGDGGLPVDQKVTWFPYPACRTVQVSLYVCDKNSKESCLVAAEQNPVVQTLNVSTGAFYRKMMLPAKGKISFHSDFCGVDVTDDSSGIQSNWSLLKQAISDYNSLKSSKSTSSGK